jgi:hypothetical protein
MVTVDASNKRSVEHWFPSADLPAGQTGVLRLGVVADGDRLEIASDGDGDIVQWRATPVSDKGYDGMGLHVTIIGRQEGATQIPLRYVPRDGKPLDVQLRVRVTAPEPPPPPPMLTVEGKTFKGRVHDYYPFQIRLMTPLAPDHRWEVKEAVFRDREQWHPIEIRAQGEEGLFLASTRGEFARIVFIQKSDGWQLFPDTVTLLLDVMPVPKC